MQLTPTKSPARRLRRIVVATLVIALPSCGRLTCSQKRHRAIEYVNLGAKAFADGLHAKAVNDFKRAVQEDDGFVVAHYNLAKVYQEMKKWDDASRHLVRVTTLDANDAHAHMDLGVCYQMLGRYDLAKASYEKALSIKPRLFAAHYRMGEIHEAQDRPKQADAAYRKAIQINGRFLPPFLKLGLLYLNHDYATEALQVLEEAIRHNEASPLGHNYLGVAHQMLKHYDKAVAAFKKALQIKPDLYDALYNLGMAYAAADKPKLARETLQRFTEVASNKKSVDQEWVRAAYDKIAEIHGTGDTVRAPLPKKLK